MIRQNFTNLFIFILVVLSGTVVSFAQDDSTSSNPVQTIKGRIINNKTQQPIEGATIRLAGTALGAYSKSDGSFRIPKVRAGRHVIIVTAIGYDPYQQNILVTSGKEFQLFAELSESFVETDTVRVTAGKDNFTPINESSLISSTVFSKDDVERFAGSRMDPARMAQNYAGVLGANDLRNDIIIRGGSPTELLWRLDGLDIPNPNHFATQGATGGPVGAINSTLLSNSDFMTGAFPAEYNDKMSGVFDLRTRKGNMERYEYIGQFGFNGFELGAEGPIPGVKGAFIANYRYSFLDLLEKMGFDFGFAGIPRYQDGTLKADIFAGDKDQVSFTGLFGISDIDIRESKTDSVYTGDMDIRNGTDILSLGVNWQHLFTRDFYIRLLTGTVYGRYRTHLDSITTDIDHNVIGIDKWLDWNSSEGYYTARLNLYYSPGSGSFFTAGLEPRIVFYNLEAQRYSTRWNNSTRWAQDEEGNSLHFISFLNWNLRITEDITSNIGIASQYLDLTNEVTIEPRASLSYRFLPLHSFNLGFGLHRQSLPLIIYFSADENEELDFMQSMHYVAGYSWQFSNDAMLKIEGYYKDISRVPVERNEKNSISFMNVGASFGVIDGIGREYISTGTGRTYGAEFSFIKNFSNHYYVTATASYVRQQYKGSDGILRFGMFDNLYILNLLAGYEWVISPSFTLEFSGRITTAGGAPYTPIDTAASASRNSTFYIDEQAFSLRNEPYSRLDIRIDFRNYFESFAISSYISIENLLDTKNIYLRQYDARNRTVEEISQLGFFFVGGFRIEF